MIEGLRVEPQPGPRGAAMPWPMPGQAGLSAAGLLSRVERRALDGAVASSRRARAGTDLVREGERADNIFIVSDGWACRYMTTRDGGRQLPALLLPGDIGNLDTLMFERSDFGVRTLTAATVLALPRERALALAVQHPGIGRAFTWLALVANAILGKWTLSLGRLTARERLAHLLCELAVRLGSVGETACSYEMPLTQEQVADVLGLTPVHVNRTMQQLRADGLIETTGRRVTLPELNRLRRIGGFDPRYLHLVPFQSGQPTEIQPWQGG